MCNLGQIVIDRSTKLSDTNFSTIYFTADILQFCSINVKICFFDGRLSTFPSIPSISGTLLSLSLKS